MILCHPGQNGYEQDKATRANAVEVAVKEQYLFMVGIQMQTRIAIMGNSLKHYGKQEKNPESRMNQLYDYGSHHRGTCKNHVYEYIMNNSQNIEPIQMSINR